MGRIRSTVPRKKADQGDGQSLKFFRLRLNCALAFFKGPTKTKISMVVGDKELKWRYDGQYPIWIPDVGGLYHTHLTPPSTKKNTTSSSEGGAKKESIRTN